MLIFMALPVSPDLGKDVVFSSVDSPVLIVIAAGYGLRFYTIGTGSWTKSNSSTNQNGID
jgi:hypothetical protein